MEVCSVSQLLVGFCIALISYLLYKRWQWNSKYPAGPLALPMIGNLHQIIMAGSMSRFLQNNWKKYGNVFTIEMSGSKHVVVNTLPVMHELFVKNADNTSNRSIAMLPRFTRETSAVTPGLVWAPFPHWKTMRSFALNVLREEGMGKSAMEPKIVDELQAYLQTFVEPNLDKPLDVAEGLMMATSNVISAMVFGSRFDYDDDVFKELIDSIRRSVDAAIKANLSESIPFAQFLPGNLTGFEFNKRMANFIIPTMKRFAEEHKSTLDRDNPRDYIDQFLLSIEQKNSEESVFTDGNLATSIFHLFIAGTDTTSTALRWALLYMCRHPDVQKKVQQEVDSAIGPDRLPSYKDRTQMSYTDAVLTEVLRVSNIVPTALPHRADREIIIEGQKIPANANLMINMASALLDEKTFEDPSEFRPERFLDEGRSLKAKVISFSLGRRVCLGESLARMELFLFFVTLMQRYCVRGADGDRLSTESTTGLVQAPISYKLVFTHRNVVESSEH